MDEENTPDSARRSWTHWIEIPVSDFERARKFYSTIFEMEVDVMEFGGFRMGIFPHREIGVAICQGEWYQPGTSGPIVYLNANPDLQEVQDRIPAAGGKIEMPKKQISPEYGFMALFIDSEGNRMALHSSK
jgi:uncharacterized protein